jgi:hypothetical protein
MQENYNGSGGAGYGTYSTLSSNNLLQPVFTRSGLHPPHFALQTQFKGRGTGMGPTVAAGYDSPHTRGTAPSGPGGALMQGMTGGADSSDGGSGPANLAAADVAGNDPFNPIVSPTMWAVLFLVVGLLGLRYVHWRG